MRVECYCQQKLIKNLCHFFVAILVTMCYHKDERSDNMNFGEQLKKIRTAKGFTQESLADKIGVQKQTISRYENSDREPNVRNAKRIADALGVTLADLALTDEMPDTQTSAGHREEEYEESKENILRDYVMEAYSLHPENFVKLKEYLELLVLSQKDQDDDK